MGQIVTERDDQKAVSDSARSQIKRFCWAEKMKAADIHIHVSGRLFRKKRCQQQQPVGPLGQYWGDTRSIPVLLIHSLTKNRQRDGGEEVGQPWGEPKPHTEQPHHVGHSLRSSLHEEETLENTVTSLTIQGVCLVASSHHLDPNSNVTLPWSIPKHST